MCCLRWNNGALQMFSCGVWTDVPGGGPQPMSGQPGGGAPQAPKGGGTATNCFEMVGGSKVVLPQNVNSGDTILISDIFGAFHQTAYSILWYCPDGYIFADGSCFATLPLGGSDPIPTQLHFAIIAEINGTFYDVLGTSPTQTDPQLFTVPSGISNAQVTLQLNTDNLASIDGSANFCVTVTNNQATAWMHDIDLTVTPGGFVSCRPTGTTDDLSTWIAGTGWKGLYNVEGFGTTQMRITLLKLFNVTKAEFKGSTDLATTWEISDGNKENIATSLATGAVTTGDYDAVFSGSAALTEGLRFDLESQAGNLNFIAFSLHVEGTGTDPFA